MKQIEIQLRNIDGYDRLQYRNHLAKLVKTSPSNEAERYNKVIQLIDKLNAE